LQVKPEILAGIFDVLSKAIALKPGVKLDEYSRMADFMLWGCAIAEAMGYTIEEFRAAYYANIGAQNLEALAASPVGTLVLKLMEDREEWIGSPSELLTELERLAEIERINTKAQVFPKAPNSLTRRLNEIKTNLLEEGIEVERIHSTDRKVIIRKNTVRTVLSSESLCGEVLKENGISNSTVLKDDIPSTFEKYRPTKNHEQENHLGLSDDKDGILHAFYNYTEESDSHPKTSESEPLVVKVGEWMREYSHQHLRDRPLQRSDIVPFIGWVKEWRCRECDIRQLKETAERLLKLTPENERKEDEGDPPPTEEGKGSDLESIVESSSNLESTVGTNGTIAIGSERAEEDSDDQVCDQVCLDCGRHGARNQSITRRGVEWRCDKCYEIHSIRGPR